MSVRELAKRVAVAALGIPLALALIYLGGWPLSVTLALIASLTVRELYLLGIARGVQAFSALGMAAAAALPLVAGGTRAYEAFAAPSLAVLLAVFFLSAIGAVWRRWPDGRPLSAIPLTLAGVVYAGGGVSFAILLRHLPDTSHGLESHLPFPGPILLAFPLAVTWMCDTAAYFFGHLFGNRKLMPSVSPGKTVVGGVAGLIAASATGAVVGWIALEFHPDPGISALLGGAMGGVLGLAAQVGDLVESVFKREAGVKDSGALLPGHGGMLDRFDALLFTLPLTYALLRLTEALQ